MGIKHRADSGFRKFRVVRKLCLGGQVSSFEMPYVSYPNLGGNLKMTIKDKIQECYKTQKFARITRDVTDDCERISRGYIVDYSKYFVAIQETRK